MQERGLFYLDGSFNSADSIRKKATPQFDKTTEILQSVQRLNKEYGFGATEAVWEVPAMEKPLVLLLATDIHYGSDKVDYEKLKSHLNIVERTPNVFMVSNGDNVDTFNVNLGSANEGVYENPLNPQRQTEAMMEKLRALDSQKKIGCLSFGNHDNFIGRAGYDFWETWGRNMNAKIFLTGGLLHILHGTQHYELAMTHRYWGTSKLNPTNSCKRFCEHEYPTADILFLGHTHQSELLTFERGGKERIGVIGGTYKIDDDWARKQGIGGRGGMAGISVVLYPFEHKMIGFKHLTDAIHI